MQNARLAYLFGRYIDRQCTNEEFDELMALVEASADPALQRLLDSVYTGDADVQLSDAASDRILNNIYHKFPFQTSRRLGYWFKRRGCHYFGNNSLISFHKKR